MFKKKNPELNDESIAPKLELLEIPGLLLSFLWFHRGLIVGALVLYGLYRFVNTASDEVVQTKYRDHAIDATVFSPTAGEDGLQLLNGDRLGADADLSTKRPAPQEDLATIRFRQLLETADAETLIRKSRLLTKAVSLQSPAAAMTNISLRQEMIERLKMMELELDQTIYITIAELEALSQLDALNVQHRVGLPDARQSLLVLANDLIDHPNLKVASKAGLAIVAAAGIDMLVQPTEQTFVQLLQDYEQHIEMIMHGTSETVIMAHLLQRIISLSPSDERCLALKNDFLTRAQNHESADIRLVGVSLHERLVFGDLGLESLVGRMDGISQSTLTDIDEFYRLLNEQPSVRPFFYQLAVAIIGKHLQNEEFEHAGTLISRLRQIQPQIDDQETQHFVSQALEQYEEQVRVAQVGP